MSKLILRSMWVSDEQWAALANTGQGNASKAVRDYADSLRCWGCDEIAVPGCPVHDPVEVPPKRKRKKEKK